jgi:hypothetical protein
LTALRRNLEWLENLDGKTLAGTSAGAYAIAKHYYRINPPGVGGGLGLLPYKILAHWQSPEYGDPENWERYQRKLENNGASEPILKLREGKFRVYRDKPQSKK